MTNEQKVKAEVKWNGDAAVTLFFKEEASEILTISILSLSDVLKQIFSETLIDVIPAYQSLTLCFDLLTIDAKSIESTIKKIIDENHASNSILHSSKLIEIPVCYDETFASDLKSLAEYCQLKSDDVIELHTQEDYLVNMLGFLPGFLYLSGLNEKLYCPRKKTPSLKVPAGAVAIGGSQTGIYPVSSPGGWHIIGRTPIPIFKPKADEPFIAQPLDKIRFVAISKEEFDRLRKEYDES